MTTRNLIVLGAGGHALSCLDVIEQTGQFQVAGFIGTQEEVGSTIYGRSVIGIDEDLPELVNTYKYAFLALGQIESSKRRNFLYHKLLSLGYLLPTIVSPFAYVSERASIAAGTIVMHSAIVNAGAKVGSNCILNSRSLVEHDVRVGDHCHISTGAILNGNVHVGKSSLVGSGAVIREGVSLGDNCLIGMGLTVRHNQKENTRYIGDSNDST